MSLTRLWEWLQDTSDLTINGEKPVVTGFRSLRGRAVVAQVRYTDCSIRVVFKRGREDLKLSTKLSLERIFPSGNMTDSEQLRAALEEIIRKKIADEDQRRDYLLSIL